MPLLWRHGGGRSGTCSLPGKEGDAEVDQRAVPVALDDDVGRLVVTVHDASRVGGRQAEQRSLEDRQRRLGRQRRVLAEDVAERDAVDRLHDDRRALRRLDVLVEPRDVGTGHPGEHVDLVAEHRDALRVGQQLGREVLDRRHLAGRLPAR